MGVICKTLVFFSTTLMPPIIPCLDPLNQIPKENMEVF